MLCYYSLLKGAVGAHYAAVLRMKEDADDAPADVFFSLKQRLQKANVDLAAAKAKGKKLAQFGASLRAGLAFVALYTIPAKKHAVPKFTRLEPSY